MRVAVLVHPAFRDGARAEGVVRVLAEKHGDAIVVSPGAGPVVYALERAALRAGLRVAAVRAEGRPPGVSSRRVDLDEVEPWVAPPPEPARVIDVVLHELRPGVQDELDSLCSPLPRRVTTVRGDMGTAWAAAVAFAAGTSEETVVFSDDPDWPGYPVAARYGRA